MVNNLESASLPFKDISEPESKLTYGAFSEIKELENQGYLIKIVKGDSLKGYFHELKLDTSVLSSSKETAGIVKKEMDLLDKSLGGIADMIPPHQLIIAGDSEENFGIVSVMAKVEGSNYGENAELFGLSEKSLKLQKQLQQMVEASLVVFDESVNGEERVIPDILQLYDGVDGAVEFKNIMVGTVEGKDREVWFIDNFPLLRMRNDREAINMLNSYLRAIESFDNRVYDKWFSENLDSLMLRLSEPDFREEVESYKKMQAGRISQMDLDELSDVRKEYLLRSFFRDMYWGKGATEWDTVRNQMENSVSKRIFETKERLESNYIEKVRQEFKANSGYDVEKIEIVNKTESPQFSEIWDSGKFAIPVKSSELKEILEKGLVGKNRQVSISSSDALFTETPYFAGLSENFSTEETNDGICYLIYTAHSETEFSALPYNCELQTKDGRTFFAVKREESPYIDKTDYFIPSHDIRAVIVGNENMFNFVVDKLTGSEVKGVPVVQLSPKKPLSAL